MNNNEYITVSVWEEVKLGQFTMYDAIEDGVRSVTKNYMYTINSEKLNEEMKVFRRKE